MKKATRIISLLVIVVLSVFGLMKTGVIPSDDIIKNHDTSVSSGASSTSSSASPSTSPSSNGSPSTSSSSSSDADLLKSWSSSLAPNYYKVTGKAQLPAQTVDAGQIYYQGLDNLGRTGNVYGNIDYSMFEQSAGWRAPFDKDVDGITGWYANGKTNNGKAGIVLDNGKTYNGYFYNRSHLIADSLGGASSRKNIITGTRMQNVGDNSANPGGMAYTETESRNLLKSNHDATILYYVKPIYFGNELVARGTTIDIRSSDGSIDQHVVVWNYANGYTIDYNTGTWRKD
jgi:DNA-entry nuclease